MFPRTAKRGPTSKPMTPAADTLRGEVSPRCYILLICSTCAMSRTRKQRENPTSESSVVMVRIKLPVWSMVQSLRNVPGETAGDVIARAVMRLKEESPASKE